MSQPSFGGQVHYDVVENRGTPVVSEKTLESVIPQQGAIFVAAVRSLLGLLVPPAKQEKARPVRLRSTRGRALTDNILAATSLDDLVERIDATVIDSELWEAERAEQTSSDGPENYTELANYVSTHPLDMLSLEATLGKAPAQRCQDGWAALCAALRAFNNIAKTVSKEPDESTQITSTSRASVLELVDYVYAVELGQTLRDAGLSVLRFAVVTLTIARAEERDQPRPLQPWLAHGLADMWASTPENAVQIMGNQEAWERWLTQVVLDIASAKTLTETFDKWVEKAKEAGFGIYSPLDSDAHTTL